MFSSIIHLVFLLQLHLLLMLPRILHPKAVVEDLADIFQGHTLDFWIAKPHGDPTEKADGGIEAECA